MAGSSARAGSFSRLLCRFQLSAFLNGLCLPHDDRLRHVICLERTPVLLKVSAEQSAGQTMRQLGYGVPARPLNGGDIERDEAGAAED
jgi:hypothetical protein